MFQGLTLDLNRQETLEGMRTSHLMICPVNGQWAQDSGGAGFERLLRASKPEGETVGSKEVEWK